MPIWNLLASLGPCALDKNSHSIGRVNFVFLFLFVGDYDYDYSSYVPGYTKNIGEIAAYGFIAVLFLLFACFVRGFIKHKYCSERGVSFLDSSKYLSSWFSYYWVKKLGAGIEINPYQETPS